MLKLFKPNRKELSRLSLTRRVAGVQYWTDAISSYNAFNACPPEWVFETRDRYIEASKRIYRYRVKNGWEDAPTTIVQCILADANA